MTRADMGCWRCVWNDAEGFCGIWLLKTHGTLRDLHCSSLLVTSSQFIYSWAHVTTFVHPDRYTSILRELRGRRIFAQNERSGPIFTLSEFLTQFGRIRQLVVGECLESDARITLRGNLCLPNFLFESSMTGDTAAGTPTMGRISHQNTENRSKSARFAVLSSSLRCLHLLNPVLFVSCSTARQRQREVRIEFWATASGFWLHQGWRPTVLPMWATPVYFLIWVVRSFLGRMLVCCFAVRHGILWLICAVLGWQRRRRDGILEEGIKKQS